MSEKEALLEAIEKFIARHGIPETVFGMRAMNDPSFIAKLRKGRSVRIDTAEHLRTYMRDFEKKDGNPRPRRHDARASV